MAKISTCACGSQPVWVKCRKRFIIACPNKQCDINICSYPNRDTAIKYWNEEVERFKQKGERKDGHSQSNRNSL